MDYDVVRGHVGGGEGEGGVAVGLGDEEGALRLCAACCGVVTLHNLVCLVGAATPVIQGRTAIWKERETCECVTWPQSQ